MSVVTADLIGELHREFRATGDPAVRDRLFEHYQGLAIGIATRMCRNRSEQDDVTQVASMGLIKALMRFDPDRGVGFSTFAWSTIQGEVRRYFRDYTWGIHVSRRDQELYLRTSAAIEHLTQDLGRSPTIQEIACATGDTEERVVESFDIRANATLPSIDAAAPGPDGEARQFGVEDEALLLVEARRTLGPALERLPEREQRIVAWRFYENLTQAQIAERLGMSQMHVSRLLSRSLASMRSVLVGAES